MEGFRLISLFIISRNTGFQETEISETRLSAEENAPDLAKNPKIPSKFECQVPKRLISHKTSQIEVA